MRASCGKARTFKAIRPAAGTAADSRVATLVGCTALATLGPRQGAHSDSANAAAAMAPIATAGRRRPLGRGSTELTSPGSEVPTLGVRCGCCAAAVTTAEAATAAARDGIPGATVRSWLGEEGLWVIR